MYGFIQIFKQEIFCLFISPATYVSTFYFVSLIGICFRFFLEHFSGTNWILPPLSSLMVGLLFCSPGIIPFLTMRSFSEERKLGTLHVLMTAPVSPLALVLGKWVASLILLFTIFGLTFCYPILTTLLFPAQSLFLEFDNLAQWASIIIFLFFYGASFTAIGIFSSTLTKNQMVSGMLTFTLISIYLAIMTFSYETAVNYNDSINVVEMTFAALHSTFNGLAKIDHFSLGLVDVRSILHQLLVTIFFLFFSVLRIERLRK